MRFHTRKWIRPEDLNANGTLFGGRLLQWIDEEAALYSIIQMENQKVVTKFISEIDFKSPAYQGDIIEIGIDVVHFGKASLTLTRSEEHTSELQSRGHLVCRLLLEKK